MALTFAIEGTLSEYLSQVLDKRELRSEFVQIIHAENTVVEIDMPKRPFVFMPSSEAAWEPSKNSGCILPVSITSAYSPVALVPVRV